MVKTYTGKDAKGQFKPLSEADIQAHTDSTSYSNGHSYYLNNAIFDPILRESVLQAQCGGSSGGPYRVQATLVPVSDTSSNTLASFGCSCPRGGFCKHIVALLLTWLHHPERFAVRTGLMGQLMEKSRAEAGEWANAQVVFATIAEEAIAQYEGLQDEGQISWILGECAAGLVTCLEAQSALPREERFDVSEREELLTALFSLWRFGYEYGGIETDIPGAVADNVTEDERTMIEGWLREEMRQGQDFSSAWNNRYVIGFLTRLKAAAQFSDEDLL